MYGWVIDGLMIWVGYMWMVWVMADLYVEGLLLWVSYRWMA